jgi:glyoxylase-like metal-dependent hydrolase (beta-lactamase superfamily II)
VKQRGDDRPPRKDAIEEKAAMPVSYDVLVTGSSVTLADGSIGWSSIVLVESGGKRILYDCGHHVTRTPLRAGFRERKLGPGDIDILFLSHLHTDHVLNVDLFPDATVMVSEAEWSYAEKPHVKDSFVPGYIRTVLQGMKLEIFSGEPEIAPGVTAIHAPGHTPGLYGLAFENIEGQSVIIAGDAIKTSHELLSESVGMEFDAERRSGDTIRAIKARADHIVPGHFPPFRRQGDGWLWDKVQPLSLVFR